jgi:hypothetical protein
MKNFINESWVAVLVLILLIAAGYGAMHLILYFGGY